MFSTDGGNSWTPVSAPAPYPTTRTNYPSPAPPGHPSFDPHSFEGFPPPPLAGGATGAKGEIDTAGPLWISGLIFMSCGPIEYFLVRNAPPFDDASVGPGTYIFLTICALLAALSGLSLRDDVKAAPERWWPRLVARFSFSTALLLGVSLSAALLRRAFF
ncbi:MAG TPA: hypothetical protein VFS00_18510 [Polyangiaceae bacterium]|nr:hypothetical protein [Polyangiaceae bacterium]